MEYISQLAEFEERNGEYWCLSPLQPEKTPSFSIRRETQQFYDFSAGVGGDVLNFIKLYHRCSIRKAIVILQEYAGVTDVTQSRQRLEATSIAKRFAGRKRPEKEPNQKVIPDSYLDQYEFSEDRLKPWLDEGITLESLRKFEVKYDAVSNRIVYPCRDIGGRILNIQGRTLDANWQEKKIRKYSFYFQGGIGGSLCGLHKNFEAARGQNSLLVFEGIKSVLKCDSWGIHNTAALLTSHLNPQQFKTLVKLSLPIVFALDAGVNPRKDANIMRLKRYVDVSYIVDRDGILEEKDAPVDKGLDRFRELYERMMVI